MFAQRHLSSTGSVLQSLCWENLFSKLIFKKKLNHSFWTFLALNFYIVHSAMGISKTEYASHSIGLEPVECISNFFCVSFVCAFVCSTARAWTWGLRGHVLWVHEGEWKAWSACLEDGLIQYLLFRFLFPFWQPIMSFLGNILNLTYWELTQTDPWLSSRHTLIYLHIYVRSHGLLLVLRLLKFWLAPLFL